MRMIVTGATGFIGGELVKRLTAEGHQVRCLVRKKSNVEGLLKLGVELAYGDLLDSDCFKELTQGGDIVYHIAALVSDWGRKEEFYKANVEGTKELLKASLESGVKRFVYMSTSSVLWKSDFRKVHTMIDINESHPYPKNYNGDYYNESKAEAERVIKRFAHDAGLETVIIRASGVWGAGDTVILPRIVRVAKKGVLLRVGDGKGVVSPCHVDNLVQGLILAGQSENAPGNTYFINDGQKINHLRFISRQLRAVGINWAPSKSVPYSVLYILAWLLETTGRVRKSKKPPVISRFGVAAIAGSRTYSIEKAKKELGFKPVVGLEEGLTRLGNWVSSIGGVDKLLEKK